MRQRSLSRAGITPYLLIGPQIIITLIFFIWPAGIAIQQSFFREDPFGLKRVFVGLKNFTDLFSSTDYLNSFVVTIIFSLAVTFISLTVALLLATLANRTIHGRSIYKTLLIWPYAVAPAIAGILWRFLFNPAVGIVPFWFNKIGYHWDHTLNGHQALLLVILAASWQQLSYNFIFFLAGLQSVPHSLNEAAAIDGAGPLRRFWNITLPLLSPTTFFLLVMNIIYAFFSTFGVIQTITQGGPAQATNILVYKVYNDGFVGLNIGGSSAQSVILMIIVTILTVIQFRYIEKKVHY